MIPRLQPYLKLSDLSSLFSNRDNVFESFEKRFAELTNSKYALLLPYGRSAVYFFLKAFQIRQQEIILPAYTCQSVIGPILETSNIPVFADSKEENFNINENDISSHITKNTKSILVAAMYGTPIQLDFYEQLKTKRPDIHLIGDYALGLFTYLTKQKEKALDVFDLAFFSFGLGKELTFLGGGALITNNRDLYHKVKKIRDEHCLQPSFKFILKTLTKFLAVYFLFKPALYPLLYYLSEKTTMLNREKGLTVGTQHNLPYDFYLFPTQFQIRFALHRLKRIQNYIDDRKRAIDAYYDEFKKISTTKVKRFILPKYCDTMSHFPILVSSSERDALLGHFIKNNIHTTVIFKKTLDAFYNCCSRSDSCLRHAQSYANEMVVLPLYHRLQSSTIKRVVSVLHTWQQ
jgi:dTDP-4-amino-4,6-dideoxygalactose transaminase